MNASASKRFDRGSGRDGEWDAPVFVISVAAELAQMHPQTLRQYDRLGLVVPKRQAGKHRRYSQRDIDRLRRVQELSSEGVSLEGIRRMIGLEKRVETLMERVAELEQDVERWRGRAEGVAIAAQRIFAAGASGEVAITRTGRDTDRLQQRTMQTWAQFQLMPPED
ncbi:heat shock protein transcriptional repressor HspR [Pseudoglutamicibacter albus]|uniref:MerR family transcriptional regulator/heat shock protein HspR n=1 Tax=Pseudoglutamicibacter albus TaxID=98671 RepID=A0ABU1Z2M6_9MICC|nr:MerR family transcriptional regulator [Pseudoglutamicibacter albus]MDR7294255.1 MerR family transcriptional regulator/heat shock protein HspR [Pseudoglutamicibacter albus]